MVVAVRKGDSAIQTVVMLVGTMKKANGHFILAFRERPSLLHHVTDDILQTRSGIGPISKYVLDVMEDTYARFGSRKEHIKELPNFFQHRITSASNLR